MKITLELPDTTSTLKISGIYDMKSGEKVYSSQFNAIFQNLKDKAVLRCVTTGIGKGKLEISSYNIIRCSEDFSITHKF